MAVSRAQVKSEPLGIKGMSLATGKWSLWTSYAVSTCTEQMWMAVQMVWDMARSELAAPCAGFLSCLFIIESPLPRTVSGTRYMRVKWNNEIMNGLERVIALRWAIDADARGKEACRFGQRCCEDGSASLRRSQMVNLLLWFETLLDSACHAVLRTIIVLSLQQ